MKIVRKKCKVFSLFFAYKSLETYLAFDSSFVSPIIFITSISEASESLRRNLLCVYVCIKQGLNVTHSMRENERERESD